MNKVDMFLNNLKEELKKDYGYSDEEIENYISTDKNTLEMIENIKVLENLSNKFNNFEKYMYKINDVIKNN